MERWRKLNVYVSTAGFILFIISLLLVKHNPLFLCLAAFGFGIAFKGFKNIYKNVEPPGTTEKDPYEKINKKQNKKKRKNN